MQFVDLETARAATGLRLIVAGSFPSPWSEAAKAIFRVKKVPFVVVRSRGAEEGIVAWTGSRNVPVAIYDSEPPRTGWAEILALGERLAPESSLVPAERDVRVRMYGYSHEIMGEGTLLWCARLLAIDASLASEGREGFPLKIARFLAPRYGWEAGCAPRAHARVLEALDSLDALLRAHRPWALGESFTALDIYAATAMSLLAPLPEEDCPMLPPIRTAFEWVRKKLGDAITDAHVAHRDLVFARRLGLPVEL